jgi:hypothetical protein
MEVAEQVRYGLMDRAEALTRVQEIPDLARLTSQMEKIGIGFDDF